MTILEHPPQPFQPGDIVEMMDDGFVTFHRGEQGVVESLHWGTNVGEWCIQVRRLKPLPKSDRCSAQGYRSSRFKLVKKGPNHMSMNTTFVFFKLRELITNEGEIIERPDTDTMTVMEGTYKDAEEMARSLLKDNPDAKIVYGRLDILAKVEAPPVKFTKL
jgi:hypothetical protein